MPHQPSDTEHAKSAERSAGSPPSVAFIGWNPFQMRHVLEVARLIPGSCMVIEKRADHVYQFDEEWLLSCGVPVIMLSRRRIKKIDGLFDVIVCQTPFSQMDGIEKSRIAMIQYGYAKAGHNYGPWRAAADLCLVYGEEAARHIRPLCPVEITGNPAFDRWHDPSFHARSREKHGAPLDPARKTILYAPTWGDLSTTAVYLDEVIALAENHNVILKLHHNTDLLDPRACNGIRGRAPVSHGSDTDLLELLSLADVVLSDYSGAIFDALCCKLPVILLHDKTEARMGDKLNAGSPEYTERHRIGPVIEQPGLLARTVAETLDGTRDFTASNDELRRAFFRADPGAAARAATALIELSRRS